MPTLYAPARWLFFFLLVSVPGTIAAQEATAPAFDVLVRNGRVVDGTGSPWFEADVGIVGDEIARIGDLDGARADRVIDAEGLVVAPGFVDPHTHVRGNLVEIPTVEPYVRQGVTTVMDGNDGGSPLPLGPFLDSIAAVGVSPNFGLYVGHGSIRREVMGNDDRAPTADELERMRTLVARGMEDGALGLSTGLAYVPGTYAETDEVIELARVADRMGGIYISHMRDEVTGVLESVRETIRIGEASGIPVQMTHHKIGGHRQFGQSAESIRLMREARSRGVDVTFDQYPYTASSTGLSFLIPSWAKAGDRLEERLENDETRARILEEMLVFIDERFADDPSRIQLVGCDFDPELAGETVADVLREAGREVTPRAAAELVLEFDERGDCGAIFHSFDEEDVRRFLRSDYGMIGSDGSLVPFGEGNPHPRGYGAYPRVLGHYVREEGVLPLERAVWKMTAFPAQRLGLQRRGVLREGMLADVTVFDPERVIDRATFVDPHRYSEGIEFVLVNGVLVLDAGEHTGARPGRVLRGPAWMGSR